MRMRSVFSRCLPLILVLALPAVAVRVTAEAALQPPRLHARSAILVESETGTVLYQLDPDRPIPPASLTKLMTLHIALSEIEAGRLDPDQWIVPGPDSWARAMPPDSSLMFLGPGQRLTIRQLLEGLVVDSGNDAAVAIADRIAGSVPAFVALMNSEAERLGFRVMHFADPAGIDPASSVTAREYAEFCRIFIRLHPQALADLLSLRQLTYPLPVNLTDGGRQQPVTQHNRNTLLGRYAGVDGLKTGYIDESGYHMAVTAMRDSMRLIAVVMGIPDAGEGGLSGETLRAEDSAALLDYGFESFVKMVPRYEPPRAIRVWKGRVRSLVPVVQPAPLVVVRRDQASGVRASLQQVSDVVAPVRASQEVGRLVVEADGATIARFPLRAGIDVAPAGPLRRALDSVLLFFRGLRGRRAPV